MAGIFESIRKNYYYSNKIAKEDLIKFARELDDVTPYSFWSCEKYMKELLNIE